MKRMFLIMLAGVAVFCVGSVVAYYNTSSFGYDNANLITFRNDAVQVMDFEITYKELERFAESVKNVLPSERISISCK